MDKDGHPVPSECQKTFFGEYYKSPEISELFEKLYSNIDGMGDQFVKHWSKVSKFFAENPYVVGYDLLNEPWPANYLKDKDIGIPHTNDVPHLQNLYQKLSKEIRMHDKRKIIMFEPSQIAWVLPDKDYDYSKTYPSLFTETPGSEGGAPSAYSAQEILNDHSYCSTDAKDNEKCKLQHQDFMKVRVEDAKKLDTGLIITEFGSCGNDMGCFYEVTNMANAADQYALSYSYWQYKPFHDFTCFLDQPEGMWVKNPDGSVSVQDIKVKALARSYPQKYQGKPHAVKFDPSNGSMTALFTLDLSIEHPTLIYGSQKYYYPPTKDSPTGARLSLTTPSNGKPSGCKDNSGIWFGDAKDAFVGKKIRHVRDNHWEVLAYPKNGMEKRTIINTIIYMTSEETVQNQQKLLAGNGSGFYYELEDLPEQQAHMVKFDITQIYEKGLRLTVANRTRDGTFLKGCLIEKKQICIADAWRIRVNEIVLENKETGEVLWKESLHGLHGHHVIFRESPRRMLTKIEI